MGKVRFFQRRRLTSEEGRECARRVLSTPIAEREQKAEALHLDDPEMLLSFLSELPKMWDTAPARVLEEATFLYHFLEGVEVRYPSDPMLYDEREYFLGEAARIAGTAARFLSLRNAARNWFDLSEAWFLATENGTANIARLCYQKLALRFEEREFDTVLKLLPFLISNFARMGMPEDALKSRLLRATVLKEAGRLKEAAEAYRQCAEEAKALHSESLLAAVHVNLVQLYGFLGDTENAVAFAREATPILQGSSNHLALAKLQLGLGHLLRTKKNVSGSIEAFRLAQAEFDAVEMRADIAAIHLVVADLLLDAGQPAQAEWEIRAALPIIDEYKLVPEGVAAFSLLRDSLRRRQIDRNALRELHGYFPRDS